MLPIPSLKAVDVGSEGLSATLCPTKAFGEFLVETILAFVEAFGDNMVMLHSDQELVLVQLLRAVQSRRVKRTLMRHGPRASHRSQGKIENANRVISGVCPAVWLSLENLLQEKLASESILRALLVRHAAWSLTRFQVNNDGRTAFVRVLGESVHEPSVAIWRKSDVQVHGRADRQSGSEMGPWYLGWQSTNDRRAQPFSRRMESRKRERCTACHLKRFVISELKKCARTCLERRRT